jgi:nicotinamidase/pyrazinamidase
MTPRKVVLWEVDAQADFMLPGGKLYVPGAEKLMPQMRRLVDRAIKRSVFLVSSGDAHAANDSEFQTFPPHCVKGTPGANIVSEGLAEKYLTIPNDPAFRLPPDLLNYPQVVLEKQTLDVFDNPHASTLVARLGSEPEYLVFGVVTEFCVRCAAKGLVARGRKVSIVRDAIESLESDEGRRTLEELQELGAGLITTDEALEKIGPARPERVGQESTSR